MSAILPKRFVRGRFTVALSLAAVLLTRNEEIHLERVLLLLRKLGARVYVVDSYSSDRTVEIAQKLGAAILQNRFVNYSKQFQWALDNHQITEDWILRIDADEVLEDDLIDEIKNRLPRLPRSTVGINLKRKHVFMGRWVRYGGRYPLVLLRIWRNGYGRIEDRWMDEHMIVCGGDTVTFSGGFADHNLNDLTFFIEKHNQYATREALDALNQRLHLFPRDHARLGSPASRQAALKRWVKETIYNRIPFTVSAFAYFIWRYLFQLGFLDGKTGLIYHFLQGFWYRFLVGAKILELESAVAGMSSKDDICRELSKLTGRELVQPSARAPLAGTS
ncbi:glycosyltransferase family 2 protein [Ramlibacter henchirensis]|uniref:Glycosyltransferase family 2 protein n=2 Tax=Ramlibacter henchirensis TaxID=204072 RepID=A0A4Z0BYL7_9BURK|nr:glycosyltransferase family 2 protein [Ramlibacter henchirensis]